MEPPRTREKRRPVASLRPSPRRRVLSYLRSHGDEITYLSARKLGERCGVSESTVIRAVQSLGYEGYPAYQSFLRSERLHRRTTVERFAKAYGPDPVERAFARDVENLRLTWEGIDREAVAKAARLLAGAPQVWVLGLRSSHAVAVLLHHGLSFLGVRAHLLTPGHGDLVDDAAGISGSDVAVVVALPRYTRQTVEAAALVHGRGATVIAVTDGADSPLAPLADLVLPVAYDLEGFIESFTAATCLAQALLLFVAEERGTEALRALEHRAALRSEWNVYWDD